jgi:hypothetical protein
MALEKNEARCNVLLVAHEDRLYADVEGIYWLESDEGGAPREAQAGFTAAVEELLADGDLEKGEPESGVSRITVTEAGEELYASWGAGR